MPLRRSSVLFAALAILSAPLPARAEGVTPAWLIPPVDAPISVPFRAPASKWGPGHRGVDFAADRGTAVRAAADGVVTFAGPVAGAIAVTLLHEGGVETTYSSLNDEAVTAGDFISQGQWIGHSGESHPHVEGLHFGVKVAGEYADPAHFFGPIDVASAVHLVPLEGTSGSATQQDPCSAHRDLYQASAPPDRNIAVAIAGIGSKTEGGMSAEMYEQGPEYLGYRPSHIYRFSYRGIEGPRLHAPYSRTDTFGDLREAAAGLRDLLHEIAREHPGVAVDLIAHSQGGIVARAFLELEARSWDPDLPRVAHLVTFATPHQGAPASSAAAGLKTSTLTGGYLIDAASRWALSGGPIPDPNSVAAMQLAPGSDLMDELGERDVMWGTQVLALAIPNDVVVPTDRAVWPDKLSRVVTPSGVWGHGKIVASTAARGMAYDFLRDAPDPCRSLWDVGGPPIGWAVGAVESSAPFWYRALEGATGLAALPAALGTAARLARGPLALSRRAWNLGRALVDHS